MCTNHACNMHDRRKFRLDCYSRACDKVMILLWNFEIYLLQLMQRKKKKGEKQGQRGFAFCFIAACHRNVRRRYFRRTCLWGQLSLLHFSLPLSPPIFPLLFVRSFITKNLCLIWVLDSIFRPTPTPMTKPLVALLLVWSLFVSCYVESIWKKTHVKIKNSLPTGTTLTIHCKLKNDNLGIH